MVMERIRVYIERPLKAAGAYIASLNVSPNTLTTLGLALAVASPIAAFYGFPLAAVLLIGFSGLMDVLDGAVAKASGRVTKLGGFLDSVFDRIADSSFILALYILGVDPVACIILLAFSLIIPYVRAKGELLDVGMAGVGLLERQERTILFVIIGFAAYKNYWFLDYLVWATIALAGLTVAQRIYRVILELRQR